MHAAAYIMNALRILHYKLYYPQAFYTAAINRYGIKDKNNSTFDYIEFRDKINTVEDLKRKKSHISHLTDNPAKEKSQKRICDILWEMKLRGYKIKEADFSSRPNMATPSKRDDKTILLPLQSIVNVGEVGAEKAYQAYQEFGDKLFDMTKEELAELKIDYKGKQVKPFDKKFLSGYFGEE